MLIMHKRLKGHERLKGIRQSDYGCIAVHYAVNGTKGLKAKGIKCTKAFSINAK